MGYVLSGAPTFGAMMYGCVTMRGRRCLVEDTRMTGVERAEPIGTNIVPSAHAERDAQARRSADPSSSWQMDERHGPGAPSLGALLVVEGPHRILDSTDAAAPVPPSDGRLRRALRWAHGDDRAPSPFRTGAHLYPIVQSVTTLGRALSNAVTLLDSTVSREHAYLDWQAGAWWIENISERNPLWVAGRLLAPGARAQIVPGEIIRLGHTSLRLLAPRPPDGDAPRAEDGGDGQAIAPDASATGLLGPGVTLQFALRDGLSPGSRWVVGALCLVVFLVSALLTLGVISLVGQDALASGGWRQALAALTLPLIPALGVGAVVAALDRYEREPVMALGAAFLWGAVIAIPPTLIIERRVNSALAPLLAAGMGWVGASAHTPLGVALTALAQAANASVMEEALKGLGLLLLLLLARDEFDNVTDGLLYGALIGAGFAMVENIVYFAAAPHGDLGFLIVGRVALGWLSHSTFTALFGAGLGLARETRARRAQWLAPLAGLVAAILLHAYFDFVAFAAEGLAQARMPLVNQSALLASATLLAEYGPLFLVQLGLLWVALGALRREAAIVRAFLADEVMRGVVTPDEYIVLQDAALRGAAERTFAFAYGPRAYLTARAFYQTATGLAFRKWHVAMGDAPKRGARQPEDAYRERIPRLRRSLERRMNDTVL